MHLLKALRRRHAGQKGKNGGGDDDDHDDNAPSLVVDVAAATAAASDVANGHSRRRHDSSDKDDDGDSDASTMTTTSHEHSGAPTPDGDVQTLTIDAVAQLCAAYKSALAMCASCAAKLAMVRAVKLLCAELVKRDGAQAQRLTSTTSSDDHDDNNDGNDAQTTRATTTAVAAVTPWRDVPAMQQLLQRVSNEPAALRARHGLALYRFSLVLEQELEDESLSVGTGFLSNFTAMSLHPARTPADNSNNNNNNNNTDTTTGNATASNNNTNNNGGGNSSDSNGAAVPAMPRCAHLDLPAIYHNLLADSRYLPSVCEMHEILRRTADVLRAEANVVQVRLPAVVVGDIHGQVRDLLRHILPAGGPLVPLASLPLPQQPQQHGEQDDMRHHTAAATTASEDDHRSYLFLGDYVDRGANSLQCICLLFVAKLLAPRRVFLLRGNHESQLTNRHYGFLEECHRRYPILNYTVMRAPDVARLATSSSLATNTTTTTTAATKAKAAVNGNNNNNNNNNNDDEPVASEEAVAQYMAELSWDMSDHPLWLLANDAFRCLPLCAVLCERVQDGSGEQGSGATRADGDVSSLSLSSTTNTTHDDAAVRYVPRVAAMHGGLSPYIGNSLDGVLAISRVRDVEEGALADLLWADPVIAATPPPRKHSNNNNDNDNNDNNNDKDEATAAVTGKTYSSPLLSGTTTDGAAAAADGATADAATPPDEHGEVPEYTGKRVGFAFNARGVGHTFGEDVTYDFLRSNHLRFVVRAHQCVLQGYQWQHQHRVLTVFSATNYCGTGNKGAVLLLSATAQPHLVQYAANEDDADSKDVAAPMPPRDFL